MNHRAMAGHSFTLFVMATNRMNAPHQGRVVLGALVHMGSWDPERVASKLLNVTQPFSSIPQSTVVHSDPQHGTEDHVGFSASHLSGVTLFYHIPHSPSSPAIYNP